LYIKGVKIYFIGFSGADISNLCNEAAIFAARADKEFVE
jgi:ATP-dependent Zn protease